jgi:hypothetical protein
MYVPLRLYMYPMGLVYPLGAHLCPLGVKYTPPPSVHAPPPGVRAPFRRSCLPLTVRAPSLPFAPSPAPSAPRRFAWSITVEIHLTFAYAMLAYSMNGGKT